MTYCKYTNEKVKTYKANETRYKMIIYKMTIHKMKNLKIHRDDKLQNFSANESSIFYFLYNQDVYS